jgi:hypothetical protein
LRWFLRRGLAHFDAEHFRETKLGEFYVNNLMAQNLTDLQAKTSFDFGPFFRALKSATAYGTEHGKDAPKTAVLLLQSDAAAVRGIKDFLAGVDGKGKKAKRVTDESFPLYKLDKDTFIATLHEGRVLAGKSQEHLHAAWEVIEGKGPNLTTTAAFKDLADETQKFILAAGADGFAESVPTPVKLKLLRRMDHLRVLLDERGENLFLSIALEAESAGTAQRVKKMVEGLIALAAEEKSDDKNIQLLADSAKVTAENKTVSAAFEFPVERFLEAMKQGARGKRTTKN